MNLLIRVWLKKLLLLSTAYFLKLVIVMKPMSKAPQQSSGNKFACEMIFSLTSLPHKDRFTFYGGKLVSTVVDIEEKGADIERDIFLPIVMESQQIEKELKDGIYKVFVSGEVSWESDPEWETGVEDGSWIFEDKEMQFIPLSTTPAIDKKILRYP